MNSGVLAYHNTVRAAGRVNGPAFLLTSTDEGLSWSSVDLSNLTAMILDIKFVSESVGFIAGATNSDVEHSHALVLRTKDGGRTWTKVYESSRPWEITWKLAFPTKSVGYVTVQNYDQNPENRKRFIAETSDGGSHWTELPLVEDHALTEFGIAFAGARHGWVGGSKDDFETFDGGQTWKRTDFGKYVNKFRVVPGSNGLEVFAVGSSVFKTTLTR